MGASGDCNVAVRAFLWEDGHLIDLTKLIPPHIELTYALSINDRGQIAAIGRVPGGGDVGIQHAFLLTPTDESDVSSTVATENATHSQVEGHHDVRGRIPRYSRKETNNF